MTTVPCWARVRGPLGAYAEGFRAELERLGYTPLTAAVHVRLMAHLSRWLARHGMQASELSPAVVEAYFAERRAVGRLCRACQRASVAAPGGLSPAVEGGRGCCAGGAGKSGAAITGPVSALAADRARADRNDG